MAELSGRIALVTGGGRGIGRAIALSLASAGADVGVTARSFKELDETAAAIRALGRRAEAIVCDVSERIQVDAMIARVSTALGDPLILVNNAGIAASAKVTDTTDEMWDRMLRVNASGAFYCTRAVLPLMLAAKWGRIVNMASVAARAALHRGLYRVEARASRPDPRGRRGSCRPRHHGECGLPRLCRHRDDRCLGGQHRETDWTH